MSLIEFRKIINLQRVATYFFLKQLCVFFTAINSSHYSVYKSIEVR